MNGSGTDLVGPSKVSAERPEQPVERVGAFDLPVGPAGPCRSAQCRQIVGPGSANDRRMLQRLSEAPSIDEKAGQV